MYKVPANAVMESRWCEANDCKCQSDSCIINNTCSLILRGYGCTHANPAVFQKAKVYNDYHLSVFNIEK